MDLSLIDHQDSALVDVTLRVIAMSKDMPLTMVEHANRDDGQIAATGHHTEMVGAEGLPVDVVAGATHPKMKEALTRVSSTRDLDQAHHGEVAEEPADVVME